MQLVPWVEVQLALCMPTLPCPVTSILARLAGLSTSLHTGRQDNLFHPPAYNTPATRLDPHPHPGTTPLHPLVHPGPPPRLHNPRPGKTYGCGGLADCRICGVFERDVDEDSLCRLVPTQAASPGLLLHAASLSPRP